MRLGLDGTPLLGSRTGIGRYVAELVHALAGHDRDDLVVTAFSGRAFHQLPEALPRGVSSRGLPVPASLLQAAWSRSEHPRVQRLVGRVDVFHGTNFVLPPTGRAGGVVTVHDLAHLRFPGTVSSTTTRLTELVPRSLRRAACVCVPSRAVAAELAETYPSGCPEIVVTPLGVAPGWAGTPPPDPAWLADRRITRDYVVFTGTRGPRKDLATLVEAHRSLGRPDARPQLVVVGGAGWGPDPLADSREDTSVVQLGHLPDADVRGLVAGARALVYPSVYEGFGLPLLEAFACGTPVIASDIPTSREVLEGADQLAAFFPVGDVDALAHLLGDPPARGAVEDAARREVASRWQWSTTAEATRRAYALAAPRG